MVRAVPSHQSSVTYGPLTDSSQDCFFEVVVPNAQTAVRQSGPRGAMELGVGVTGAGHGEAMSDAMGAWTKLAFRREEGKTDSGIEPASGGVAHYTCGKAVELQMLGHGEATSCTATTIHAPGGQPTAAAAGAAAAGGAKAAAYDESDSTHIMSQGEGVYNEAPGIRPGARGHGRYGSPPYSAGKGGVKMRWMTWLAISAKLSLKDLGKRRYKYRVEAAHYDVVGQALIDTLAAAVGEVGPGRHCSPRLKCLFPEEARVQHVCH